MGIPEKSSAMRQATPMPPISIGLIALLFRQELMRMGRLVAAQPPYETADGKPCHRREAQNRHPAPLPDEKIAVADNHGFPDLRGIQRRSEEHTSELQSLMRNSYAVFCLTQK